MGSLHSFLLLPTFFSLFVHCYSSPILEAALDPVSKAHYNCTRNSTLVSYRAYGSNVKTLLDWLSSNGTNNARFCNTTVTSKNASDTVYGTFLCTRDINQNKCQECVIQAAKLLLLLCTIAKEAIVWYQNCYVHYSDRHFFSTVEESPKISFMNNKDYAGDIGQFNNILWDTMNNLRIVAASASNRSADKVVNITNNQKLYGSAWCLPYLSKENCSWCIGDAIAEIPTSCCRGKSGGYVLYLSCCVRYDLYPFHKSHFHVDLVPPSLPNGHPSSASPGYITSVVNCSCPWFCNYFLHTEVGSDEIISIMLISTSYALYQPMITIRQKVKKSNAIPLEISYDF